MTTKRTVPQGDKIDTTLAQRFRHYGSFRDHAAIAQDLKGVMAGTQGWKRLVPDQRESLEMIAHKISRILNGNPNYKDSWHDIAGYARLVEQRINEQEKNHAELGAAPSNGKIDTERAVPRRYS